jgi:hypothetical protein
LVGFDSELHAAARGWIHAADGSIQLLVLFWTAALVTGWKAGATGRHNEGLGVDGTLDGPRFPEQVHGGVSGRVLCDLFSAATQKPAFICAGRATYVALAIVRRLHRPGDRLECAAQLGDGRTRCQQRDAQRGVEAIQVLWRISRRRIGLLNPIFFAGAIWAMFAFWRRTDARMRRISSAWDAPVFLGYAMFSFYKRVFPNWIAPSVVPLFCLMVIYWQARGADGMEVAETGTCRWAWARSIRSRAAARYGSDQEGDQPQRCQRPSIHSARAQLVGDARESLVPAHEAGR